MKSHFPVCYDHGTKTRSAPQRRRHRLAGKGGGDEKKDDKWRERGGGDVGGRKRSFRHRTMRKPLSPLYYCTIFSEFF